MREFLYQALTTPLGIVLQTDDVELLRSRLSSEKRKAKDPQLDDIVITRSRDNPDTEVWIFHRAQKTGSAAG